MDVLLLAGSHIAVGKLVVGDAIAGSHRAIAKIVVGDAKMARDAFDGTPAGSGFVGDGVQNMRGRWTKLLYGDRVGVAFSGTSTKTLGYFEGIEAQKNSRLFLQKKRRTWINWRLESKHFFGTPSSSLEAAEWLPNSL
jgi:hypothetical protein